MLFFARFRDLPRWAALPRGIIISSSPPAYFMTQSALTIWTNAKFPDEVRAELDANVAPHRLIYAVETNQSNLAAAPVDAQLAVADIAFGQPDAEQAMRLSNLKWVHLTTAGYTAYDRDDFKT